MIHNNLTKNLCVFYQLIYRLYLEKKPGGHLIRLEDISEQIFQTRVVLPPDFSAVYQKAISHTFAHRFMLYMVISNYHYVLITKCICMFKQLVYSSA